MGHSMGLISRTYRIGPSEPWPLCRSVLLKDRKSTTAGVLMVEVKLILDRMDCVRYSRGEVTTTRMQVAAALIALFGLPTISADAFAAASNHAYTSRATAHVNR
jgi:hypothetical protein